MNKQELEKNVELIIDLYKNLQSGMHNLIKGIKVEGEEQKILDDFCYCVGIEKNEETRFVAYSRIVDLRENNLELYLEKNNFDEEKKRSIIDYSYKFVCDFHSEIQAVVINVIVAQKLLPEFYIEIFKGVANVGLAMNELFIPWRSHIIYDINKGLEEKFDNDSDKIMGFLSENNLFDKGYNSENADRSYSALVLEDGKYKSKSYSEVFSKEVGLIVRELDIFIVKLSLLEDEIYNSKNEYIDYLTALKSAFLETDIDNLINKWSAVDEKWMKIKTPFQIGHPLEFYEDKYRKAVAPEWDLRIQNKVFESDVENSMLRMYENFFDDIGRDKYKKSYNFSLSNMKRVQLYLTSPVLYYSSELTGMFSAQVVPNDEEVSKKYGKKIFAFPEMVLESKRSEPFMKLQAKILDENLLEQYRKILFSEDETFYKIYDIETIGHEYGHTLWLDTDSETLMNKKTGSFKNLEEFKATTGGLVMYFMNEHLAPNLQKELIVFHIIRCIGLIKYMKVNEVVPYYCEALIHLNILFESGIIIINSDSKIELLYDETNYSNLKKSYINYYEDLIKLYLDKRDSGEYLSLYTVKEGGYYLPKDEKIRNFVEYFYQTYKVIGNDIDESVSKDDYLN